MKWNEFLNGATTSITADGQVLTDIECPKCGRKVYLDTTIILTSYPVKYKYWCRCGWSGCAHIKWSEVTE